MIATQSKIDQLTSSYPAVFQWIIDKQLSNSFAASLLLQVRSKGTLSEKQIATVKTIISRDEAQAAKPRPTVDTRALEQTFAYAKARGINQPKLRLDDFLFKVASAIGNNSGAIWVTMAQKDQFGERLYLGKIKDGLFQLSRDCTPELADRIAVCASNPSEAAKAYGRRTGCCCVCGRELTRNESIDAMIGPICAEKYGF